MTNEQLTIRLEALHKELRRNEAIIDAKFKSKDYDVNSIFAANILLEQEIKNVETMLSGSGHNSHSNEKEINDKAVSIMQQGFVIRPIDMAQKGVHTHGLRKAYSTHYTPAKGK